MSPLAGKPFQGIATVTYTRWHTRPSQKDLGCMAAPSSSMVCQLWAMRLKARWLAQHGGPPGWLEESDPAGCDFARDGRYMLPALTDHTTCPGSGADLLPNVHKTPPWSTSRKEGMAWYTLVDPCILSGCKQRQYLLIVRQSPLFTNLFGGEGKFDYIGFVSTEHRFQRLEQRPWWVSCSA